MNGPVVKKPHLIKNGARIICNTENYVPIVVLGSSTTSFSSTSSNSARPASQPQESTRSTPIPASVECESADEQVRANLSPDSTKKKPTPNENEDHEQVRVTPSSSEIPGWLREFRKNLVDESVPEPHELLPSSIHEPNSVYTHFPKDRNCEICHRTKITRATDMQLWCKT